MNTNRRDFLKDTAFAAFAAGLAGCATSKAAGGGATGSLVGFRTAPMDRIRVGFIGVGERGMAALHRVMLFKGVEVTAVGDIRTEAAEEGVAFLKKWKLPGSDAVKAYCGKEDSWKALCEDPNVDILYILTPAHLHTEMIIYGLECGKHVLIEVPGCQTIEQGWRIVRAAEKAQRHCYMLENRCFRELETLAYSMCHQDVLGELAYAEGAYIHPLAWRHLEDHFRNRALKQSLRMDHNWNTYPTHPLGPICRYFDINCGDRMTTLVSMSTDDFTHPAYAKANFPPDAWQNKVAYRGADMNTTLIRTAKGRTIELKFCLSTPRPYTRINQVCGTKGIFQGEPFEIYVAEKPGGPYGWDNEPQYMNEKEREAMRLKYMHPLWKTFGETVKKAGSNDKASKFFAGHGGVDYIMDLSWIYALRNGLPMPQNVYDLATWSSIVDLTRMSVQSGSSPVEIPDFTCGAWSKLVPQPLKDIAMADVGFDPAAFVANVNAWAETKI